MKKIACGMLLAVTPALWAEPGLVTVDRDRATTGQRTFQVVNDGTVDGRIEVYSAFVGEDYVIHDHSASSGLGIDEDLFMRLDGETFAPLSVHLSGDFGGTHIHGNHEFEGTEVSGLIRLHRPADGAHQQRPVQQTLPEGFFLRGSALYLANAIDGIGPDSEVSLSWFNALDGQVTPITLSHAGEETIEVPAGRFETRVLRQSGGQPENLIYVDAKSNRIVRFDVIGQPIRLELLP